MPQLDGLRAILVLAVMYTHYLPKPYWIFSIHWGGWAVRVFFIISGFLMTQILLNKRETCPVNARERYQIIKKFYIKRFLRLAPVFYLALLFMYIFNVPNTRETFWWHIFYLSNIHFAITNSYHQYVAHLWSLAVEFQFYLVWPLVMLFLSKKAIFISILVAVPAVLAYRFLCPILGVPEIAMWVLPPYSLDALLLGALLALLSHHGKISSNDWWFKICAWSGATITVFGGHIFGSSENLVHTGPTLLAIFFSWVVLRAAEGGEGRPWKILQNKTWVNIGKISYGIYVFHLAVQYLLEPKLKTLFSTTNAWTDIGTAMTMMLISTALATISWRYFEEPINRYRRHF